MHRDMAERRLKLTELCRRYGATPAARNDPAAFADFKDEIEALLGPPGRSYRPRSL